MIVSAKRVVALCATVFFLTGGSVSFAGMIGISPLRVDFDAENKSGVVRIFNTGDSDMSMQVDIRDWSQSASGEDQFEPATDVVAVPPIFSLGPGEVQLIRMGIVGEVPMDFEKSYRLFLTELPPPRTENSAGGLRMRLIVSVPVFSAPIVDSPVPGIQVAETTVEGEQVRARLHNPGKRHIRVAEVAVLTADGERAGLIDRPRYILPGASQDFIFDAVQANEVSRIAVTDTVGTIEHEVLTP